MDHLFLFGNTPAMSWAELNVVNQRFGSPVSLIEHPHFALASFPDSIDINHWQQTLGGTVKIYLHLGAADSIASIPSIIVPDLVGTNTHSFALSSLNAASDLESLAAQIKDAAKEKIDHSIHFRVLAKPSSSAGSVQKFADYLITPLQETLQVFKARTVQEISRWDTKDYSRPAPDPRRGMMPPKISRLMANLALPEAITPKTIVFDPFCGTGTILMEALELGASVIGSDLSPEAISQSSRNLDWYQKTFNNTASVKLFKANAAQLTPGQVGAQVDSVVFEGFLGPPHLENTNVKNLHKGLHKLYLGTLKRLHSVLKSSGRLVCALPEFTVNSHSYNFNSLIDTCEKYGYTQLVKNLTYSRPKANIRRSIFVLQKKS